MSTSEHRQDILPPDAAGGGVRRMAPPSNSRARRVVLIAVGLAVLTGLGYAMVAGFGGQDDSAALPTAVVKRGDLVITVTEGGTLNAMKSVEIKSKAEGRRTILKLVDEGTVITPEDVANGMVLVELDSSDLEEREGQREINFYNSEAAYKKAQEDLAIQKKQNESDIALAKLDVKFARMELERYLGAKLAKRLIDGELDFSSLGAFACQEVVATLGSEKAEQILGSFYAECPKDLASLLGGVAQQTVRNLSSNVLLADSQLANQDERLTWTKKLYEKEYVSRNEVTTDELKKQQFAVQVDSAQEDLRLFIIYTLPKEAEQRFSDYQEAKRKLERVEASARSKLAQAEAQLKSSKLSYELNKQRLDEVKENIAACTIKAPVPGRVVYPTTGNPWRRRRIAEGEQVWQNQTIITIPDLSTLAAHVNVHETDIEKLQVGQPALITVEAIQGGKPLSGRVAKISPVASSAQAWLNPDVKVYEVDVALDEVPEGLTPGMTATAEIVVDKLTDVLYIPIEAVTTHNGKHVVWVKTDGKAELRTVTTGKFTEKFVEVKDGLKEGEIVYLEPPQELPQTTGFESELDARLKQLAEQMLVPQEQTAQPPTAAGPEAPSATEPQPQQAAPAESTPGQPAAETEAQPEATRQAASEYLVGGQINWAKIGQELQGLSPEEKARKFMEIISKLPEKQRKEALEFTKKWQGQAAPTGGLR